MTKKAESMDHITKWAETVIAENKITDACRLRTVNEAVECMRRIEQAREQIKKDGIITYDRWKAPKANPAVRIEHENSNRFIACLKYLDLSVADVPKEPNQFDKFIKRLEV